MHILTRWNYRKVRANRSRTITVFLAVVGIFALWVGADFVVSSAVAAIGARDSGSIGIDHYLIDYIRSTGLGTGIFLWAKSILENINAGTLINSPFFRALSNYLSFVLLLVMTAVLYSVFAVTTDETLRDYRTLHAAGTTVRQIRKTLMTRAIFLDLVGAVTGIVTGLLAAWISMGITAVRFGKEFTAYTEQFMDGLPNFFLDVHTIVTMTVSLLIAPCTMAIASTRSIRRSRKPQQTYEPKYAMIHPPLRQRVFGMGGVLAGMSGKMNRRYRAIFTISFAVCLAVPALMDSLLLPLQSVQPTQDDLDLAVDCYNYSVESAESGSDVPDGLLRQAPDQLCVKSSMTCFEQYEWTRCSYVLLDSDWFAEPIPHLDDPDRIGQPFLRDGRTVLLCKGWISIAFLDDDVFLRTAREMQIGDPAADGAICYSAAVSPGSAAGVLRRTPLRLEKVDPQQDVALRFVPYSFLYNTREEIERTWVSDKPVVRLPDDEFLRAADPVSVTKTVRILGLTQTLPEPFGSYLSDNIYPILIFPRRMYASFAQTLSGLDMASDYSGQTSSRTLSFYSLQDPESGCDAFREAVRSAPDLDYYEDHFGYGGHSETTGNTRSDPESTRAYVRFADLNEERDKLEILRSATPGIRRILLCSAAWILFVGVLNTAHMNRLTRRRENAILESIGLDNRQKTGMRLYESALYALSGALLGWFVFLLLFFPIWRDFQNLLQTNGLFIQTDRVSMWDNVFRNAMQQDLFGLLREFVKSYARSWWIFVGGGVLIFVLMIVIDWFIDRRSKREDLIQILTDDSADYIP